MLLPSYSPRGSLARTQIAGIDVQEWNSLKAHRLVHRMFPLSLLFKPVPLGRSWACRSDPDIDLLLGIRRNDYESAIQRNRIPTDRLRICTEADSRAAGRFLP